MVDASAGRALMNKTLEEAWESIESMANNYQHFKVRATSAAKGVFEVTPSESTILAKSLVYIAAMLKEIKEGQAANSKPLIQHANTSQQVPMSAPNCKKIKPLPRPTTFMTINNLHPTTDNITHNLKHGVITNKTDGIHLNNHNQTSSANHTHITNHKTHKTKDTNHLILDKPTLHQMFLYPIMKKLSLLHKFTNQPTTNPQPQPSTSTPLPSQTLPNPKGGINMVHNENDEEEEDDEWLFGLLAELEDSDDDSEDKEVEEEPKKEVDDEEVEEETKGETFFIATIFRGNEVKETEMLVKCEDPGSCLTLVRFGGGYPRMLV
ncbi:hypothetical protein PIB30_090474 [Stylosanthes scabra]|uniref:Uncharacterized protein n=1 Tax=Stylosanthes scabra TaxID=79078 RepID=A0ABU6SWN8_9FABA|nr:hypothetical protein [Stylosanthes scabra]